MTVYLLHFSEPICPERHTTQHYLGSTMLPLEDRLTEHANGRGARLTQVAAERGITFQVARTWEGGWVEEQKLKRQHNGPRLCPICNHKS